MCTAISYNAKNHYFGRNLDLDYSYDETVTIAPRNFSLSFRNTRIIKHHYAIIGMAYVCENYPLYYEATNEKGLSVAGLNFPNNAVYMDFMQNKENIAPFEFIPYILAQCKNISEAKYTISKMNIANINFSHSLLATPLHWLISDRNSSIVVEPQKEGLKIYDNSIGILTNNPPFEFQMYNLISYMKVSASPPKNEFSKKLELVSYSRGMGSLGLPGDLSSQSRFVRAAFTKFNSVSSHSENINVSQFFHILDSVAQVNGCNNLGNGNFEYTIYSSCCNTDRGIYYYTTYYNRRITAHDIHDENLDSNKLISYPLNTEQDIKKRC